MCEGKQETGGRSEQLKRIGKDCEEEGGGGSDLVFERLMADCFLARGSARASSSGRA